MIKKTCSPIPVVNLLTRRQPLFRINFFQTHRVSVKLAFALLSIVLSVSAVSAQTRAGANPEERARRVDEKRPAGTTEADKRQTANQPVANPLVRRTALSYTPKTGDQSAKSPALVNDIIIISRMGDDDSSSAVRHSTAPRAVGARGAMIPSIWPVSGPLTDGFGVRGNPFGGSSSEFHKGQDIAAPSGTPVMATADGTVVIAGWKRGYGWVVYLDHGNGLSTRYGHLSRIDVTEGQTITRGQQLGLVGSTGRSTGPHLHYEVRINDQAINPMSYLPPPTQTHTAH